MAKTEGVFVKAKKATSLAVGDGTNHEFLQLGQPIEVSRLAPHLQEKCMSGDDPWLNALLESSSKEEFDAWNAALPPEPPKDWHEERVAAMEGVALPPPDQQATIIDAEQMREIAEAAAPSAPKREPKEAVA